MTTALASRRVALFESTNSDAAARIDEAAGVIRGVKVLGFQSRATGRTIGLDPAEFGEAVDQPYRYDQQAVMEAAPLYQNVRVYIDHPEFSYRPDGERIASLRDRKLEEVFGQLVNPRVTDDGLYADLEYVKSHPRAAQIIETAKRFPHLLALSHNAKGEPVLENAQVVIKHISDVRSVDLVGERPGTTHGLFESAGENMPDALGTPEAPIVGKSEETIADAKYGGDTKLHEDDPAMAPTTDPAALTEDAADGDPTGGSAVAAGDPFDAAFEAQVVKIWNGEGSPQEKARRIAALAKHKEGIQEISGSGGGGADSDDSDVGADLDESDPEPEAEPEDEKDKKTVETEPEAKKDDKAPVAESAPKIVKVVANKSRLMNELLETVVVPCVDLLNSQGVPVRGATLSALCRTPAKRRRALVESFADPLPKAGARGTPRSQAGAVGIHETSPRAAQRPGAAPQTEKSKGFLQMSTDEICNAMGLAAK